MDHVSEIELTSRNITHFGQNQVEGIPNANGLTRIESQEYE